MGIIGQIIEVLLIENDPGFADSVRNQLARIKGATFDVTVADSLTIGMELVAIKTFDAVLLDFDLPDSEGTEAFHSLFFMVPTTPIIILTGIHDDELAAQLVQEGAHDFLGKMPLDAQTLVRAIRCAVDRQRLVVKTQRQTSELTALEERQWVMRRLQENIAGTLISAVQRVDSLLEWYDGVPNSAFGRTLVDLGSLVHDASDKTQNLLFELHTNPPGKVLKRS